VKGGTTPNWLGESRWVVQSLENAAKELENENAAKELENADTGVSWGCNPMVKQIPEQGGVFRSGA